ncbi:putative AC9 transposase, partial [Fusarium oxysporum f. sp. albedinis]
LRAFIDETMRMSPPVPADLAREVQEGGIVVDGQYISEGMKISTASYCMHHNPDIYPEPFKFRPERWIVDEKDDCGVSPESVSLAKSAFMPFSAGPRGCVGKNLAYLEMSLALAKIVYNFEIRRDHSSNLGGGSPDAIKGRRTVDQYQLRDIFVAIRDGPVDVELATPPPPTSFPPIILTSCPTPPSSYLEQHDFCFEERKNAPRTPQPIDGLRRSYPGTIGNHDE